MRFLVTGGAGFIGSHLSERLLSLNHEVSCVDDLSTGNVDNIAGFRNHPRYSFHLDSIFNERLMNELVDRADVIVHFAAAVGVKRIVEFPVQTIETNVAGSEIVLNLAARRSKRTLIASTSEVYGKSTKFPFAEDDDLVLGSTYNSRWGYACSKAIDEFLTLAYHREKGLPATILRFFNTVGPRQTGQYGMVVPSFVKQALQGEPVTVYGSGEQTRCFGHVHDIVEGLIRVIKSEETIGEIFNLGSTEEVSINELARRIIKASGSQSKIVHIPYSDAYAPGFEDMFRRVPDISKAHRTFGFTPKHTLDEIISDVIEHMSGQLSDVAVRAL